MEVFVLLGNRMNDDGSISDILRGRLEIAKDYYFAHKPDKIIVTGGLANPVAGTPEAPVMKRELIARGIPEEIIIKEDKSLTTKQNAEFSVPIIKSLGADKVVLCTSKEHMNRWYLNPKRLFRFYMLINGLKKVALVPYTGDILSPDKNQK